MVDAEVVNYDLAIRAVVDVAQEVADFRCRLVADQPDRSCTESEAASADRMAHISLSERLSTAYPSIPIISEEDNAPTGDRPEEYLLIDPIDGTASWARGFAGYVTQVAHVRKSIALFGAIHCPRWGATWYARRGFGAYRNGQRLARATSPGAPSPLRVIDNTATPQGVVVALADWLGPIQYTECGSLGLKATLVASGEADLFVKDVAVFDWDVAPAMAILAEVGMWVGAPGPEPHLLPADFREADGVVVARSQLLGQSVAEWMAARRADRYL